MRLDPGQIEIVDDAMADVLRKKQPAERIRIGFNIWSSVHEMLIVHIKQLHPRWHLKEVQHEVARRLIHGAL